MKNLILVLLFIPLFAFAQAVSSITYKDVMSIDSKDTFLKIMVENKYSTTNTSEYSFALNPDEYGSSTSFAQYFLNNRFYFEFVRTGTMYTGTPQEKEIIMENPYDTIFEIIKRKCKYVAVKKVDNLNYACYECKKAKFDGLIALTTSGKKGIITAFAKQLN
tara:strand:+ start:132 stop:617 length:486 start_codon:yes stop_codon:yes gene_type:complete